MMQSNKNHSWIQRLENWLLPPVGQGSHALLSSIPADLDDALLAELDFWQQGCPRCAALGTSSHVCGDCLAQPHFVDRTQALLVFNDAAKQIIHGLKYQGELFWVRVLAELMVQRITAEQVDALIAVPLHPNRLVERGFNQAYELAKRLSKHYGVPLIDSGVIRQVDTPHQTLLDKQQRQRNLKAAFSVDNAVLASMQKVVLIDDVMTTGATLEQLAKMLKQAYPQLQVEAWVVAKAV
ncbi:MAG: ComF family protein [Thiotrichales bacterium]|nr:ComF family protein [Thiotrichales bacterium]